MEKILQTFVCRLRIYCFFEALFFFFSILLLIIVHRYISKDFRF